MVKAVGESRRQGRLRRRYRGLCSLNAVFRVSVHHTPESEPFLRTWVNSLLSSSDSKRTFKNVILFAAATLIISLFAFFGKNDFRAGARMRTKKLYHKTHGRNKPFLKKGGGRPALARTQTGR